jgi:hypothetical protein
MSCDPTTVLDQSHHWVACRPEPSASLPLERARWRARFFHEAHSARHFVCSDCGALATVWSRTQ